MQTTLLIAQIISVIYMTTGLGLLLKSIDLAVIVKELQTSPALTFLSGCVAIAVGIVSIHYHNIWVADLSIVVTLLSWMILLGGMIVILIPRLLFIYTIKNNRAIGIFMVIFGSVLGYFGFFS